MIHDLSKTLQAILDDPALKNSYPELLAAQIVFDQPVESFSPAQTSLNLFLYDIRENMELRSNEPMVNRLNDQRAVIQRPPLRVVCSYLVTAWPVGGTETVLQGHQLLGQALQVLSSFPVIPDKYLAGALKTQQPKIPLLVAKSDGMKDPSEFWTALGNKLRPSLTVSATICLDKAEPNAEEAALVHMHDIILGERNPAVERSLKPLTRSEGYRIGGTIKDNSGMPVQGVSIRLAGTSLMTQTDSDGRYTLGLLLPGEYSLEVQKGNTKKQLTVSIPQAKSLTDNPLDIEI
jgi:hypothetical protein